MQLSACFTGHRPEKLAFPYSEQSPAMITLKERLRKEILLATQQGRRIFYSGMAKGIDIIASELVLSLRKIVPDIQHYAVIPFRKQCFSWEDSWIERYQAILAQSDKKFLVSQDYNNACFRQRNQYMVQHSGLVIAVFNHRDYNSGTWQTIQYAQKKAKEVRFVELPGQPAVKNNTIQIK